MAQKNAPKNGLATNDGFIKGIYNTLDLNDSKEVFRYVFSRLDNEVVIYPTENYYYSMPKSARDIRESTKTRIFKIIAMNGCSNTSSIYFESKL